MKESKNLHRRVPDFSLGQSTPLDDAKPPWPSPTQTPNLRKHPEESGMGQTLIAAKHFSLLSGSPLLQTQLGRKPRPTLAAAAASIISCINNPLPGSNELLWLLAGFASTGSSCARNSPAQVEGENQTHKKMF